ncbi:MAG TPA: nuclear transport factor 2 family protein [Ohtaekwangia sp.]|uniref:YybH family protein n=1 Tax=Ohtaekwangia sp. TaxID=2066019 RepID=UPI002F955E4F
MKKLIVYLLFAIPFHTYSQDFQKEINDQVWKPFIKAFDNYDTPSFMSVHSKDLVRSPRDSKTISNYEQYKSQNEQGDARSREKKSQRTIELRFLERIASATQAFEVGIYKTTVINAQGESRSFYGKFHVVLRKENGTWKILVDSDSSENGTISEKDFLEATAM